MKKQRVTSSGFTLIELMVTLALIGVLMMVAVPSFTKYQRNAELTSLANSLLASINAAKGEAIKRGMNAMIVPKDGANWSSGWVVFVDVDRSGAYLATSTDIVIQTREATPSYLTLANAGATAAANLYIMYDASGYSKLTTGAFGSWTFEIKRNDVTGTELLSQTRRVKIAATGRARVCTPKSTTDTDCSSSQADL